MSLFLAIFYCVVLSITKTRLIESIGILVKCASQTKISRGKCSTATESWMKAACYLWTVQFFRNLSDNELSLQLDGEHINPDIYENLSVCPSYVILWTRNMHNGELCNITFFCMAVFSSEKNVMDTVISTPKWGGGCALLKYTATFLPIVASCLISE